MLNDEENIKIKCFYSASMDAIELRAITESKVATGFTLVERNPKMYVNPTCILGREEAQELMDSLWECGVRPIAGKGSAGQLKATEYHLEDMRKLVNMAYKEENQRGTSC